MAAMSTYSGSWRCSRRSVPWKWKSNSKNSSWNPTVGNTRLRSFVLRHIPSHKDTRPLLFQHRLTMDSIFYCVAKRPTEEVVCLQTEGGIECDMTDFYSCSLEKGDLVLHGQGPVGSRK